MIPKIAVHGEASSSELDNVLQEKIQDLTRKGYKKLEGEETSVDVVEYIVNELELDPCFNAGKGAKLDLDGIPRTEAGIMTHDMDMGAVIGLECIARTVSVARKIMTESNNIMIGGPNATKFALEYGFKKEDLRTEKSIEILNNVKSKIDSEDYKSQVKQLKEIDPKEGGTVGCVALDKDGKLASATSTGGRNYQLPGRIGDSPLVGCGFYCNDSVAVSTTGVGESIMKIQLARNVSIRYDEIGDLDIAVQKCLDELECKTEGKAGIIAVGKDGQVSHGYNTKSMYSQIK